MSQTNIFDETHEEWCKSVEKMWKEEGATINPNLATDIVKNKGEPFPDNKVCIEHPCPDTSLYPWDTPNELFGRILSKYLYGGRNAWLIENDRISGRYWDRRLFEKAKEEFQSRGLGKCVLYESERGGSKGDGYVIITILDHNFPMIGRGEIE